MNRDVRNLQKLMESGGLAFNSGPHWGDFADYPQSNVTVLKPSEKDEEEGLRPQHQDATAEQ